MKTPANTTNRTLGYPVNLIAFIVVAALMSFAQKATGQTQYKSIAGSQIKVSGTSTMHDWNMIATAFTAEASFAIKGSQLQDLSLLTFALPVKNLKSKEDLMDTRAYKALKSETYPSIAFKLKSASVSNQEKTIRAIGSLTIAGVTNEVSIQTAYTVNDDGTITCKGTKAIKMSAFKIKPPSFMLGALKTGDDLTIDVLLKLKKI